MKKVVAVFPGQGSQFVGMYKSLYNEYKIVQETVDEAEKITGIDLKNICFEGPFSALSKPQNAHIAIFTFGVAAFRAFISETGIIPQFCAGHSLGEYAALVCAGAMKFSDALKLVELRCKVSNEQKKKFKGGMTIIDQVDTDFVEDICNEEQKKGKRIYVSCHNSNTQVAISGIDNELMEIEKIISTENPKCTVSPLLSSAPFHCSLMEDAVDQIKDELDKINFSELRYPVMSNYTGKPYRGSKDIKENLSNHLMHPVKWTEIMNYFNEKKLKLVIDFSAKNIFEGIIDKKQGFEVICFGIKNEREALLQKIKDDYKEENKYNLISKCIYTAISTPNLNFNEDQYNNGVIKKYRELCEIKDRLNNQQLQYSEEVKIRSLDLLKCILKNKKINIDEQNRCIEQILDETGLTYKIKI